MKALWLASASFVAIVPTLANAQEVKRPDAEVIAAPSPAPDTSAASEPATTSASAPATTNDLAPDTSADPAPEGEGEILVTAQRRDEKLRDVPISITAITADKLDGASLLGMRDLQQITPGFISQNSGYQFRPTIRGIGGYAGGGAGDESNIALYIDNVYMSSPGANAFNLMNISRIEVLKGPQGTLFGRNATGGAVRIITSDPSYDNSLKAKASYGFELNSREISVLGNVKIADNVAASLSLYHYNDDGYVKNIAPGWTGGKLATQESWGARGKVLFDAADNLKIVVSADYSKIDSSQESTYTAMPTGFSFNNVVGAITATEPLTASTEREFFQYVRTGGASIIADLDLGKFSLQSTSAIRDNDVNGSADGDRTNLFLNTNDFSVYQDVLTQEFLLTSNLEGPFNFVAGVYYFGSDASSPDAFAYNAPLSPVVNGVRTPLGPAVMTSRILGVVETKSYAAFGEATLELGPVRLIGGLRYTDERKSAEVSNTLRPDLPVRKDKLAFDNLSYRATAQYKYSDTGMIYATRSTGFKSGQFNALAYVNPLVSVRPETVLAHEIGLKDRLFGFLDIAFAAYDYKYDDIQLTVFNTLNASTAGPNILLNAAKAHTRGADLQIDARAGKNLTLSLGAAYMPIAEYTKFPNAIDYIPRSDGLGNLQIVTDLSGARMPYAPKWTTNVGGSYHTGLAGGELIIAGNAYYKSRFEWIPGHRFGQGSYILVNSTVTWVAPEERWTVGVYGRNLTDRRYNTAGSATTGGFSGAWARPRELGVNLGFQL